YCARRKQVCQRWWDHLHMRADTPDKPRMLKPFKGVEKRIYFDTDDPADSPNLPVLIAFKAHVGEEGCRCDGVEFGAAEPGACAPFVLRPDLFSEASGLWAQALSNATCPHQHAWDTTSVIHDPGLEVVVEPTLTSDSLEEPALIFMR